MPARWSRRREPAHGAATRYNAAGAYVQFTVSAPASGRATVGVRFANGTTARPANLVVNGATVRTPSFEGTGAWSAWVTKPVTVPGGLPRRLGLLTQSNSPC